MDTAGGIQRSVRSVPACLPRCCSFHQMLCTIDLSIRIKEVSRSKITTKNRSEKDIPDCKE